MNFHHFPQHEWSVILVFCGPQAALLYVWQCSSILASLPARHESRPFWLSHKQSYFQQTWLALGRFLLWTTSSCCWIAAEKFAAALTSASNVALANADTARPKKISARRYVIGCSARCHPFFFAFPPPLLMNRSGCRSGILNSPKGRHIFVRLKRPAVWFGPRAKARS